MGNLLPSLGRRKLPMLEMPKLGGATVAAGPPPTLWSATDKASGVVRSANGLTLNALARSGNAIFGARGARGFAAGDRYYEVVQDSAEAGQAVGFANASHALTSGYLGKDANSVRYTFGDGGTYWNADAVGTSTLPSSAVGDVIGLLYSVSSGRFSVYKNGVLIGSIAAAIAGPVFPAWGISSGPTAQITANFGSSPFLGGLPSGATIV